ncbi:hypothetical protein CAPTEDRAFT_190797 [Capitella teleta]|uniref:NACHT domain-containing protein n=1 Tax=Capitella teleta TaxID=283909 RepID=R7TP94_CAPTE|nr:hypothetical protein CAPTEDRAFT_190797 [Capitella teleta]|eukprot:ELT95382.1 hypothetical protein CAPTEDRAFT_190797 [Capitella teleta]
MTLTFHAGTQSWCIVQIFKSKTNYCMLQLKAILHVVLEDSVVELRWWLYTEESDEISGFWSKVILHRANPRSVRRWPMPGASQVKRLKISNPAFDEAPNENEILHQLIEGKLLKHKTVLITSRHNFLQNKLSHFHSMAAVEGCNYREQLEHVKRYAEHNNIDSAAFESLLVVKNVQDLCNKPLNLTLVCFLIEEDTQLLNSRTALYTSIHNIINRKASERMHLTPAEVEESLLRPLYRLAFEANQKNETVICESEFKNAEQFEQVCQVGYLSKELITSHNQAETRFSFTHKTFLELLTAKHMMDPQERLARIHDLHYADYRIRVKAVEDKFNVRHNEPVLGFLFGLLEENPKEISFLKRDQP